MKTSVFYACCSAREQAAREQRRASGLAECRRLLSVINAGSRSTVHLNFNFSRLCLVLFFFKIDTISLCLYYRYV